MWLVCCLCCCCWRWLAEVHHTLEKKCVRFSLQSCYLPACRSNAHGGERVHCLAVGPDGLLYSGGSDKVRSGLLPLLLLLLLLGRLC